MKVAAWTAAVLALGWLVTAVSLAFPGGHPPLAYFVGAGVVIASFVVAPIGAGAALAEVWRARRQGASSPRLAIPALAVNLAFLILAVALCFWIRWAAAR